MSTTSPQQEAEAHRITTWLLDYLAEATGLPRDKMDADAPFEGFGIDSYQGVLMSCALEEWLGRPMDLSESFLHPTPRSFAEHLAAQIQAEARFAA
jgi:acyl carrier protein